MYSLFPQQVIHIFTIITTGFCVCFSSLSIAVESTTDKKTRKVFDQDSALSVNEPIYFVYGGSDDLKARFQFSFKYRIFKQDGTVLSLSLCNLYRSLKG